MHGNSPLFIFIPIPINPYTAHHPPLSPSNSLTLPSSPPRAYFTSNTNWHLNFALESVTDGGLQITRVADPTGVSPSTTTSTHATQHLIWDMPYDDMCKNLSKWVENYFTFSLGWLTNALVNALQHQHHLFLPASGVFLMQNPRFNSRGDLLVGLHYNG